MIKALIFDNNGVLTTTEKNGSKDLADLFGVQENYFMSIWRKEALLVDDGSISSNQFLINVIKKINRQVNIEDVKNIYHKFYDKDEEMHKFVKKIAKKYEVALLSNFGDAYFEFDKKWQNKKTFGDKIFVSAYLGMKKPDKKIFKHVLNNLNVKPKEAIFIDDREENIEAAKKVGMVGVVFENVNNLKQELKKYITI